MRRSAAAARAEADRLLERYGSSAKELKKAKVDDRDLVLLCRVGNNFLASSTARTLVAAAHIELEEAKDGK